MKVLQIIPALKLAGAERMCATLSCELNQLGVEVIIISLYNYRSSITEELEREGIKIIYLDKKRGPDMMIPYRLYQVLKKEKPDVIHTHLYVLPYVISAATLAKVKRRIHTVHNIASKEVRLLLQMANEYIYQFGHVIPVALSKEVQKSILKRYHLPVERVPIVYNGVRLENCMEKTNYLLNNSQLRYIHIGRFAEQKNHQLLVDAFFMLHKQNPNTELVLVGEGALQNQIKDRVCALQLQNCVTFYGKSDNVFPLLYSADVFVLPSKYEGVPMSIIEAMGTGLPIIATRVGGVPDMLEDGVSGMLTEVDVKSVADAMMRMTDAGLRERLGKAARIRAEKKFSSRKMAEEYLKLYLMDSENAIMQKK